MESRKRVLSACCASLTRWNVTAMRSSVGRAASSISEMKVLMGWLLFSLLLVALGFSGAWIGNLTALEPYRPLFIGVALVAMVFAGRRIYRPAQQCKPGELCAIPQVRSTYKTVFWVVAVLVLIALAFPYVLPLLY